MLNKFGITRMITKIKGIIFGFGKDVFRAFINKLELLNFTQKEV